MQQLVQLIYIQVNIAEFFSPSGIFMQSLQLLQLVVPELEANETSHQAARSL